MMSDNKSKLFTIDHLLAKSESSDTSSLCVNNIPPLWHTANPQSIASVSPLWSSEWWYRYPRLPDPSAFWRPPSYWTSTPLNLMRLTRRYPRKGGQIRFTHDQSTELENVFSKQKYLTPGQRKNLALKLDLTERQVKTWFQNRRAKWRRARQLNNESDTKEEDDDKSEDNNKESEEEIIEEEEDEEDGKLANL